MKKILFLLLSIFPLLAENSQENKEEPLITSINKHNPIESTEDQEVILDEILVAIYNPKQGIKIILHSDLRPHLDGSERTLRKAILEVLMLLEAENLHIIITDEEAERHLGQIQKEHRLTRKALEKMFEDFGYTYEEGREQLRRAQIIGSLIEHKVRGHLVITDEEILSYYESHPEYYEATYTLLQTFIPHDKATKDEIEDLARQGKLESTFTWADEFSVQEDDLAEDRKSLITAPPGTLVELEESDKGFDVTFLKAKTPRTLIPFKERKENIELLLRKEHFEEELRAYENELLRKATLRFTYEKDKREIFEDIIKEK